eukprot:gb/GECH01014085.1/.p1 GENE.gb/GECH01014085.1/~~gb/GECH01014085.1/.p1  ORF type:complete len:255 (+),score=28.08 gb/GECH01014085.1/:1-765(+)
MLLFFYLLFGLLLASIATSTILVKNEHSRVVVKNWLGIGVRRAKRLLIEIQRKTFHLLGMLIPGIYYLGLKTDVLTRVSSAAILGALALSTFLFEILRLYSTWFNQVFMSQLGKIMRSKEADRIHGSVFFLTGCFLTVTLFTPVIAVASMLFLILGDMCAALVGMSVGRTKLIGKKSLEGSVACLLVCFVIGLICFRDVMLSEYIAASGAVAATIAELFTGTIGVDDNLTIPLFSGVVMTFAKWRLAVDIPLPD